MLSKKGVDGRWKNNPQILLGVGDIWVMVIEEKLTGYSSR